MQADLSDCLVALRAQPHQAIYLTPKVLELVMLPLIIRGQYVKKPQGSLGNPDLEVNPMHT